VTKQLWFGTGLLLAACGGANAPAVQPANSGSNAVRSFMQAVADSNLAKMASLWGTANGPAAKTRQPHDWERRIATQDLHVDGTLRHRQSQGWLLAGNAG
jgi:hypothetical protein